MRLPVMVGLAVVLALAGNPGRAKAAEASAWFDKPLRVQQVAVPANAKRSSGTLSCFYYANLLVKQLQVLDERGARLSAAYVDTGKPAPACDNTMLEDDNTEFPDWTGVFLGARRGYVFLQSDSGFGVFVAGGEKIFEDEGRLLGKPEALRPLRDPSLRPWFDDPMVLRYRRDFLAPCSMRIDPAGCWALVRRATGLAPSPMPACDKDYEAAEKRQPGLLKETRESPSMMSYDVEATFDARGVIRMVPVSSVSWCGPAP